MQKYTNGAWTEPDEVKRYADGAWQAAESVKRYENGAWKEVWANVKTLTLYNPTITNGRVNLLSGGREFIYTNYGTYSDGAWTNQFGVGGSMTFYLDGEWTNPTISFDWQGGLIYNLVRGDESRQGRKPAGNIAIYGRTTAGAEQTSTIVPELGSTVSQGTGVWSEEGQYSGMLQGTFNRLGIIVNTYSFHNLEGWMEARVSNLLFDGREILFPEDAMFDYL